MGTGTVPPDNMQGWPAVTDFDPIDEWPDVVAQFNAETWDRENDIVGSSLTRARFSSVQEKDPSDDWDSYTWTGGFEPDLCYYHLDEISASTTFDVWTDPEDHSC